ncbi:LacI family DNA-binding transcriptional regulator [Microbacterium sp. NPDC060117]|uniref:LacI family DNA-binding transcriptional regulator n=1 Tax=Microbacterium sp. NPDC060117 TaxID=3347057 RepID=UPI00364DE7B1
MRKVTLADVSAAAGVGVATVSRALGDHPDVSQVTRDRVRTIARELGYRPSVAARALRSGGYQAISVVVPDAAWGWWEPVVRAAFAAAAEEGYQLLVHPVAGAAGGAASVVRSLANVPTEGVVVISVPDQDGVRRACDDAALSAVAIDDTSRTVRFPTVSVANRHGAREVVRHLIAQGRRRIAMLVTDFNSADVANWGDGLFVDERLAGYRDALEEAGVAFDEALVIPCASPFDETAKEWPELRRALADGLGVDAVFCVADLMAVAAIRSVRAEGLRVPEDVSIAGFDDERAALLTDPPLTTVRQPYEQMGRLAVELLLRSIRGDELDESRIEIEPTLVVRESTAVAR